MKTIKTLKPEPFRHFCMTIGELPTSYMESMTYYEMLAWFCEYLKGTVIPAINENAQAVTELQGLYTQLKEYVDNYFENLDVQDEINNKLDAMAEAGTLAEIIDQYLYNLVSTRSQETLLSMSFGMESDTPQDFLNYSNDGVNWKSVKLDGITGRDPSLVFDKKRNCFYFTVTPVSNQTHSFKIYKTTDFVNIEEKSLLIGTYYAKDIMAPDLYLDEENDKLIVNFTYATGNTVTDCDAQTINEYWLYRVDLGLDDDIDNIAPLNTPQALTLTGATTTCMIDSNIIYNNNLYYLNCKDDINKIVQIYQSADGYTYNLINANVLNANDATDNSIYLEGGSFFKFNDMIHITLDSYANRHSQIIGKCKNNDFLSFTFADTNLERMRHQSVITVNSDELKVVLYTLKNFGYNTNDKLTYFNKYDNNSRALADGFSGEITAVPNVKYVLYGNATITNIRNPFNCEKIELMFAGAIGKSATITKINDVTVNKKFYNSYNNNEKIITINLCSAVNAFPSNDYVNIVEYNTAFLKNYYTPVTGLTITDGYAIRQGNIVNLSLTVKTTQILNGYIGNFLKKATGVSDTFVPRNAPINLTCNYANLKNLLMYNVSGNITASATSIPVDTSIIISATYITY